MNLDARRVRIASQRAFGSSPVSPSGSAGDRARARAAMGTIPSLPNPPPGCQPPVTFLPSPHTPRLHSCPRTERSPFVLLSFPTTGTYIDKKCPFTGNVSIRGRILTGLVKTHKMNRTLIMRMDYLHYIKKYQRYEKRHTNLPAHISPCFRVKEGDTVVVGQCRPLSKTVRFNVLKVIPSGSKSGKSFAAH